MIKDITTTNHTDVILAMMEWYLIEFKDSPLNHIMASIRENSPYHRENSISEHTDMVIDQFTTYAMEMVHDTCAFSADIRNVFFMLAFHDVGKPAAMEEKESEERGKYLSFAGHEKMSARLWEDWAAMYWKKLSENFDMVPQDIYKIGWMIENHLPWGVKKPHKVDMLVRTVNKIVPPSLFTTALMCDTRGRKPDDPTKKLAESMNWCMEFITKCAKMVDEDQPVGLPTVHILIGASGSGKSTYTKSISEPVTVYSLDALRHKWYDADDYTEAFKLSMEDKDFRKNSNAEYMALVKTGANIIVDNVNASKKSRSFFVQEAHNKGYRVVAVLFPIQLKKLLDRQEVRKDKYVPSTVVVGQYNSVSFPSYGEFDEVIVMDTNLS